MLPKISRDFRLLASQPTWPLRPLRGPASACPCFTNLPSCSPYLAQPQPLRLGPAPTCMAPTLHGLSKTDLSFFWRHLPACGTALRGSGAAWRPASPWPGPNPRREARLWTCPSLLNPHPACGATCWSGVALAWPGLWRGATRPQLGVLLGSGAALRGPTWLYTAWTQPGVLPFGNALTAKPGAVPEHRCER